jgi:hypothetical protein
MLPDKQDKVLFVAGSSGALQFEVLQHIPELFPMTSLLELQYLV